VRRSAGDTNSIPYSVYRASSGCNTAVLTAQAHILPVTENGVTPDFASHAGSYRSELFSVSGTSAQPLAKPPIEANGQTVKLRLDCAAIANSPVDLVRVQRIGTVDDVVLPAWVNNSSATSAEFTARFEKHQPNWGDRTLNLAPLVRGLANAAVDGRVIASAYFYFVKS
jgi:hypothetical protein